MPKDYSGISIARKVSGEKVELDLIVFQDDMAHAAEVMQKDAVSQHIKYLILFLRGVARSASDEVLLDASERLGARSFGRAQGRLVAAIATGRH
tara:strand:- start:1010 stop:1291 length:282 start_codon:yes stop_codon:yes gene_type:complete